MNTKRASMAAVILILVSMGCVFANAFQRARAISSPNATIGQQIRLTFIGHKYQIAIPHRGILQEVRFSLIPAAAACAVPYCNGLTSQPRCQPGCPQGFCYCPNCNPTGCTPYFCMPTTKQRSLCSLAYSTHQECGTCRADTTSSQCQACGPGGCPP